MVETEFNFWVPGNMLCHRERSSDAGSEDTSPLLPSHHGRGELSPTSRLRRIEEGRKELMEMIRDVPESCYELSLKDIVVDLRPGAGGPASRPAGLGAEFDDKQGNKKKRRRKGVKDTSSRPGRVTRTSSSTEAGPFLIRMFLPAFLTPSKKQPASGNRSKTLMTSPRVSVDRSDGQAFDKESKLGRWPFTRDECRSHEGTSRSKSCTSRIEHGGDGNGGVGFLTGCWPFGGLNNSRVQVMKGKMCRQKTCTF